MSNSSQEKTAKRSGAAVFIILPLVLLFALALSGLALWHSGFLLSYVPVMQAGGQKIDAAVYTVTYADTLAALTEQNADAELEALRAEAIEKTEEKLSRALTFLALAEREGKLDGYATAAEEASARAREFVIEIAAARGQSEGEYLEKRYGRGIKTDDVARTAALFATAAMREEELLQKTYSAEERESAFEAHRTDLLLADCIAYSIKVDVPAGATPDEMREMYLEAEARAQKIASATGKFTFLAWMQADFLKQNPTATSSDVDNMTDEAYRYHISAKENSVLARWATDPARAEGDIAVLGANGDYTVVYCLSPAIKQLRLTDCFYEISFPYADEDSRDEAYAKAAAIMSGCTGLSDFIDRAEDTDGLIHRINAWRAELNGSVANWLDRAPAAEEVWLFENHNTFILVCYEGKGEIAVWEKQADTVLQQEEFDGIMAEAEIKLLSFGKLFLLI